MQGQRPSNINLSLFVCFSDGYRASQPFPLLTMILRLFFVNVWLTVGNIALNLFINSVNSDWRQVRSVLIDCDEQKNSVDAVHILEKTAGAKVKFVHVVRNPFDNIATMVLEHKNIKARHGEHRVKV